MRMKRGRKLSQPPSKTSKKKLLCPRLFKQGYNQEEKHKPRQRQLKPLCKSSRCLIHNSLGKLVKKREERKSLSGLLKMVNSPQKCRVKEFKDDSNKDMEINPTMFYSFNYMISEIIWEDVKFENVLGQDYVKEAISKTVIWPLKKPKLFKGLRAAPKGILLFGPLGAGKSIISKNIAFQTQSTFFNLPSPLLISEWMENSRDFMTVLFQAAKARQPSVIFIDEVERVFAHTTFLDHETNRKIKNELLFCMDGLERESEDRILVIAATKKPYDLDEEFVHKFPKRFYISLPDKAARKRLLEKLLECECHSLEASDIEQLADKTEGYTVGEIKHISQEAAMGPLLCLPDENYKHLELKSIKPISLEDFTCALRVVKPSIPKGNLKIYEKWDAEYGYGGQCKRKM